MNFEAIAELLAIIMLSASHLGPGLLTGFHSDCKFVCGRKEGSLLK
jgi:hypothetical protein